MKKKLILQYCISHTLMISWNAISLCRGLQIHLSNLESEDWRNIFLKRGGIMMNDILGHVCSHVDHIWPNQTWIVIHHYCPLHIRGLVLTQYCVRDWHSL